MEANDGELDVILRSYQREMLEISLHRNAIIVMPTGSGKTHIAVARIRSQLEETASTKLIWFLANSVELSHQQYRTLTQHLPCYRILPLTGADGVDKWTEQRLWDAILQDVDVVVGTPAVLGDALIHGFVRMSRLGLLVFDEAHHCIKDHPMNTIMKNFYHPSRSRSEDVPQILGLTASPSINPKAGSLETLEKNLDAIAVTPRHSVDELNRYVYPPKVSILTYDASTTQKYPDDSALLRALNDTAIRYDVNQDPYVLELRQYDDGKSQRELYKALERQKTYCSNQIRTFNRKASSLYEQLGSAASKHYVTTVIDRVRFGSNDAWRMLPDSTSNERQHLINMLASLNGCMEDVRGKDLSAEASPKVQRLIFMLRELASPSSQGIIFVKERATAIGLTHLLNHCSALTGLYRVGTFVGTSSFGGRKTGIADLAEPKQQKKDMEDFRSGVKNLMVATSVLEEGIDVSACNIVVNFDLPDTLIAFVQRRGRARQEGSHYCMFVAEDTKIKADPLRWQDEEAKMKREYEDASRERAIASAYDETALDTRVYRVQATGALLTPTTAKAHLYHFCSVSTLQASNYVDLRPEFNLQKSSGEKPWSATVTLPAFVHSSVRSASSREQWRSESAAMKDAAFEAYVALHRAGLVNDNLLPLVKESGSDQTDGHQKNQPSLLQVAERKSSWTTIANLIHDADVSDQDVSLEPEGSNVDQQPRWHSTTITIEMPGFACIEMTMTLPMPLDQCENFLIHWNEQNSYFTSVQQTTPIRLSARQIRVLREDTSTLLRSVHSSRMALDRLDYPVLFGSSLPLQAGSMAATALCNASTSSRASVGLVRVAGRGSKAYMLASTSAIPSEGEGGNAMLTLTPFPKRRDFLHAVPERQSVNAAYTAEELVSAKDCAVDRLETPYALFAAFVPSLLHRVDVRLLAQELQSTVLGDVQIVNTDLIIEAISAPSAGETKDYNRLEYLGDSILKFFAHLQVTAQHPTWPESYLSNEKQRLVNNHTLTQAALKLGLDRYILTKPFTGAKWRVFYVHEIRAADHSLTRQMSSKSLADVMEALIGTAYVDGGLAKAYVCLQTLLPDETWFRDTDSFSRLTAELAPCPQTSLNVLEELIGHHFVHPTLLIEAITHGSLPFQRTGMSYERLEFLGDAVLDLIVVPKLHAHTRQLKHYQMHTLHSALVNGLLLGFCCLNCGVEQAQKNVIVTPDGCDIQGSSRVLHLHDFIRASGQLHQARRIGLEAFDEYRLSIEQALTTCVKYPWVELTSMAPQKFFSDLVESVLGALYIDTCGDLDRCETFLERLGVLSYMRVLLEAQDAVVMAPKERLGVLAGNDTVEYIFDHCDDAEGRKMFACTVRVGDSIVAKVEGCGSKAEAEIRAADSAADALHCQSKT